MGGANIIGGAMRDDRAGAPDADRGLRHYGPVSPTSIKPTINVGGAMRDRTADLLRARQALSQLSYSPMLT